MPPAARTAAAMRSAMRPVVERARALVRRWLAACRRDRTAAAARLRCSGASPLRKIVAVDGQRASRSARCGSESARSSSTGKPLLRQLDRRREQVGERELARAVFLMRQRQPRHGAGHADGEPGVARLLRVGIALARRGTCRRGGGRRGLAVVDGGVAVAFGEVDHHEAAAADIAGARIGHGQRKADRDRGVDRVAAAVEDLDADAGGAAFLRHHHAVVAR